MRHLPAPPELEPGQSAHAHGSALFAFVLREGVTATLSDEQIELASHASIHAVAGYDRDPEPATAGALESIQATRAILAGVSRHRAAMQPTEPEPEPHQDDDSPQGGQRVAVVPPAPELPPAPALAVPVFDFDAEPF